MTIEIENLQKKVKIQPRRIQRIVKTVLNHEGVTEAALSLAFVTDHRIKVLNKQFLGRSYVTDVLAFDLSGAKTIRGKKQTLEGEIIISAATAARNAREFGTTIDHELILYVIHGILHLLGFDDHRTADIKKMRAKEQELMRVIGYR